MKPRKYAVYSDPGHAWLKAPRAHLIELGILSQITPYSYQRGDWVYLEEDQDVSTFINALKTRDIKVTFAEHYTNKNSRIRNYHSFCP